MAVATPDDGETAATSVQPADNGPLVANARQLESRTDDRTVDSAAPPNVSTADPVDHGPSVITENGATDPDDDGRFEDVNGDGKLTIADSQALYANLDHAAVVDNASRYDFTRDGRTDVGDVGWLFRIALQLEMEDSDGDGLSDAYERNVTGTDPHDFDSNSTLTSRNESANGAIDGMEDFDDDGLVNFRESALGTDPFDPDTDGDGLSDREEFRGGMGVVSPTNADTDGDGIQDATDDADNDTVSNAREIELGSNPGVSDTDADELDDGAELEYGTNLTDQDTDDDGFLDGEEVALGFDPTRADSDGDGVPDAQESYTATVQGENASVDITSSGHFRANTTIDRDRGHVVAKRNPAVVGPFVDIETTAAVESAAVTIQYNESAIENESNVTVARYNTSTGTFEVVDSTVDTGNNTVTGSVEHFSKFTALDQDEWKESVERIVPAGVRDDTDAQVIAYLRQGRNDAYGTVQLHDASLDESVSTMDGGDGVDSQGNGIPEVGSTNHPNGCGDDEVHRVNDTTLDFNLETCGADDAFTINYNVVGENPRMEVDYRQTNVGLVIGGNVYPASTTLNLSADGVNITDSDGDGIVDSIENGTIPLGNGLTTNTDPHDPDTDGDGLKDGTELLLAQKNAAGYDARADPNDPDTDDDGLTDYQEVVVFEDLDPWDEDTDDDGLLDGEDPRPTVPQEHDETPPEERSYVDAAGDITGNAAWGAVLGEAGIEWTGGVSTVVNNAPVTNVEFHESNTKTIAYYVGWLGVAIAPGVDVFADVRDCLVLNTGGVWETVGMNGLDCGGAALSVISKVGEAGGAVLSIPSAGLSLSITGASFAVDVAEDVLTDVGPITARAIKNAPALAGDIARYVVLRVDASVARLNELILPRLSDDLAQRVRQAMGRTQSYDRLLSASGVSRQQAKLLAPIVRRSAMSADEAATVVRQVDGFGSLSGAEQALVVRRLGGRSDVGTLTGQYGATTLSKLSSVDDPARALDAASSAASAGRAADVADVAGAVNPRTLGTILQAERSAQAARIVRSAEHGGDALTTLDDAALEAVLRYDADTLGRIADAGASSGDELGDLLQRAADAAQAGKVDEVRRLSDELDEDALRESLRALEPDGITKLDDAADPAKKWDEFKRLEDQVETSHTRNELFTQLDGQLTGLNHDLARGSKLRNGAEIKFEDISRIAYYDGRPHYILQTNKWSNDIGLAGDGMHDFKHIVARHADPDAANDFNWPVTPGTELTDDADKFPETMGPQQIKDAIQATIRNGRIGDDAGEIVYSGQQLNQYGIDELTIRRSPDSGVIQTAYP